eukprot:2527665-Rhodomonas_salina.1
MSSKGVELLTPSSQDPDLYPPLPLPFEQPLYDATTLEWQAPLLTVDLSQPDDVNDDSYIVSSITPPEPCMPAPTPRDCVDPNAQCYQDAEMWMYPVPEPDYDLIMELLEAGVKQLVQSKRMASQWRDCSVSPNKDRGFGYLALTGAMALKRESTARESSKKARSNVAKHHTGQHKGKENKHANCGKWFVDSDSDS